MNGIERYEKYKDESFDIILLKIQNGTIKSGKYANLVQIEKDFQIDTGRLFEDGRTN